MKRTLTAVVTLLCLVSGNSFAGKEEDALRALAATKIKAWANNAAVIAAVKKQNEKNASLSEADILVLDKQWRAETKSANKPLISGILSNELSGYLKGVQGKSGDLYTEIFVMDAKGLNVGQSDVTSDYWQGDEDKWSQTFKIGPDAVHIGEIKTDESTQRLQAQVSITIVDPASHAPIGAVTVGVNVDQL